MNDTSIQLHLPDIAIFAALRPFSRIVVSLFHKRRRQYLLIATVGAVCASVPVPSYCQGTNIFNCSGFAPAVSGSLCEMTAGGSSGGQNFAMNGAAHNLLVGTQAQLQPANQSHTVSQMNWQQPVNVQAFTTTFTFVPNGQFVALALNNNTNCPQGGGCGPNFSSGAGCEGGFYQAFSSSTPPWPNNVFALELDGISYISESGPFTYSSVQVYKTGQDPCSPNDGDSNWTYIPKISTYPVPLNYPASTPNASTGDTYSATVTYDGSNVVLNLYDVTAGGSCPGASCFTHTWPGINIPSIVGANTAYVGLVDSTEGTPNVPTTPLFVNSFSYAVQSAGSKPASPTALTGTYH